MGIVIYIGELSRCLEREFFGRLRSRKLGI